MSARSLLAWCAARPVPCIFCLAVCVRLAYIAADLPVPPQDTADYDEIAHSLLEGRGFVARGNWHGYPLRSWRAPFYPWFLAGVYACCGHSHLAVQLVQALVGAAAAVLVYWLAAAVRRDAAPIAGLLAAVYGPLAACCAEVMTETWYIFWTLASLVLLAPAASGPGPAARAASRPDAGRLLLGGAALGLAALTRPVGLLIWPALAWCVWRRRGWRHLRPVAWVGLAAVCTIAPWTVRNYRVHGALVPIATHGGFIVARSNADVPDWRRPDGWRIAPEVFAATPSEVERDRQWLREGLAWIRAHPRPYLRLVLERFVRFWYFLRPEYDFWFMTVLPPALAGMWRLRRAPGFCLPMGYAGASILVFSALLYGSTRFRLPLEPVFAVAASAAIRDATDRLGRRRAAALWTALVLANGALWWQGEAVRAVVLRALEAGGLR